MTSPLDAAAIRALTVKLVGVRSVSPDVAGETRCAREIELALPAGVERGRWRTPDGRPAVWAFAPGATPRTVVLLAHHDTVGTGEFAALGDPAGEAVALYPRSLRARLLARFAADPDAFTPEQAADLGAERDTPGTWLFGRGALDMKSGVATGVAIVSAWAARDPRPACGVLLVSAPDEEYESAGMVAALTGLRALRDARGLELAGALNLDTVDEPGAYAGAMGKVELGCWVLGRPTHAGEPLFGVDASELAAGLVTRVVRSPAMVDGAGSVRSVPPVALRLRDLKSEYNIQTALEAWVEFNLITVARPLVATLETLRGEAVAALAELLASHRRLADEFAPGRGARVPAPDPAACVLTYAELCARAGLAPGEDPAADALAGAADARTATLARLRALATRSRLSGPAIVLFLLPPFYPHAAPGDGALVRATRDVLAGERDAPLRAYYPLVSDACYAAWRGEPPDELARQMPALGREYALPIDDAAALDLDVVSLGPWGRDLHGLLERAHAGWTFDRMPRLVWDVLERVSEAAASSRP